MSWLLIGVAGAIGTVLRYALTVACGVWFGANFPVGTLAVNVIGSFALGLVAGAFSGASWLGTDVRLVLGVGLMGGFTTYSSFNLELLRMFEQGSFAKAAVYSLGTWIGALAAGGVGLWAGRLAAGPAAA